MKRIAILLLSIQVAAAQNISLTLQECRTMALESNYTLKSSAEKILMAEDVKATYRAKYLPNISLNGNYLYSTTTLEAAISGGLLPVLDYTLTPNGTYAYMPDQSYELEVGSVFNVSAMLSQPIYMGGRITNAVRLSALGVEISSLERRKNEAEVIESTDNAFYKVLEVSEMLTSAQRYEEVLSEFARQMESAVAHGLKTKNELLKVRVRLNEARLLTLKAENGVRLAKMNLCHAVGLPLSTQGITLTTTESDIVHIDYGKLDVSKRVEYKMLSQQIEAKKIESSIARGEYLPSISAVASYGYTNGMKVNGEKLINSAGFTGGVTMSVPILNWGEGRRKRSAKDREVTIARNQMSEFTQMMTLELMQSINDYNESVMELALCEESLSQAEENMRLAQNQYNAGMETLAECLESQALWQVAMGELCSARSKLRVAYTTYLRCCGDL